MPRDEIVMVCCSDIAGQVRGKGFPARQLHARRLRGVGWTPTNIMITAHGPIADTPWGPFGDLVLQPDLGTRVRIDFEDGEAAEHFVLSDIVNVDGSAWDCCPRNFLKRGLAALEEEAGYTLKSAFEHEFHYSGVEERPNSSYALDAFRRQGSFAELLMHALDAAGLAPDTFMPEYGPAQYEVTIEPTAGVSAADQAVILRELTRAVAGRLGQRASFTPILRPGAVGNGVHVHFSLVDRHGAPACYDSQAPHCIAPHAGAFVAGVLEKLPSIMALTAASSISYLRLLPHRWSASYTNFGQNDREASVRLCPIFELTGEDTRQQFHFEFRAADATPSPYFLLGAIVWAGVHGLRNGLKTPPLTAEDPSAMSAERLAELGLRRLPETLDEALDLLENDEDVKAWMGPTLHDAYLRHKRFEARQMAELTPEEQCGRYHLAY